MIKQVNFYSNALMILTSVHHVYGAVIYNTPWRFHILAISIPVIALSVVMKRAGNVNTPKLFWVYWIGLLVASISIIGIYEGVYNHLMKNILFYLGTSQDLMNQLFPPPLYEMPNDFFFELTGLFQAALVIPLLYYFIKLTRGKLITKNRGIEL